MSSRNHLPAAAVLLALTSPAFAHEHHEQLSEEQQNAPVDAILWIHIFLQIAVWGVLFPTGMVLGLSKSRWHVPLQVRSIILVDSLQILIAMGFCLVCRICPIDRRLYPRAFTRRPIFPRRRSRHDGEHTYSPHFSTAHARNLPEAAHT